MKQKLELDELTLKKLQLISSSEGISIESLLKKAVQNFIQNAEKKKLDELSSSEKEDLGLMLLMQQANKDDAVSEDEFFQSLYE